MMLPKKLAIITCQAHRKGNSVVNKGNNAADEAARTGSKCQVAILSPVVSLEAVVPPEYIIMMQQNAGQSEHNVWSQKGATVDEKGLLRSHKGLLVAPVLLLTILMSEIHNVDHCARGEVMRKIKQQGHHI